MFAVLFNPLTLWVSGAVVAAGVTTYVVVDKYFSPKAKPEIVAEEKAPEVKTPVVKKQQQVASLPEKQPEAKPAPALKPIEMPLPKFDVLSVNPDGSTLIAGSAPAGSKVEILDGETVIATDKAGSTNQFVALPDSPLSPGAHELTIVATLKDGKTLVSEETGIINVPDGGNDLIAMVTQPGEASRILQKPETSKAPEKLVEKPAEPKPVEPKAEEPKKEEMKTASLDPKPADEPKVVEKVEPKPEPKVIEKAPEPKPVEEAIEKAPEPKPIEKAIVKTPEPEPVEKTAKPQIPVLIQAAEVEGKKVFIAGTGQAGAMVHIYIDSKFMGKVPVGAEGAFLYEGSGGLKAGRHAVRADMVRIGSADVLARAVVSLLHEPVVAEPVKVAKVEPKKEAPKPAAKAPEKIVDEKVVDEKVLEKPPVKVAEKPAPVTTKPVVEEKTEIAVVSPEPPVPAPVVSKPAAPKPETPKIVKTVEPPKPEPVEVASIEAKVDVPAPMPAPEAKVETAATTSEAVPEIVTGSSVIIRKGDSLWRVSRRKYGQGIRYTTIFEANREQIQNPHLIFPGQILDIPDAEKESDEAKAAQ